MPQDNNLRSVVYRSFVTCDDPNGVVDCKTIRKSKKMEDHSIKYHNPSYEEERKEKKITKESTDKELQKLSSKQIMEVSKGAKKLNEVIDSWSNGKGFDTQSKHIAKDLLKGALDLQETLAMLGELQEASQYISKPKKKHKEKKYVGVDFGTEFMDSSTFQKPRISADSSSSSRDCYDELREAIRENFARQKERDFLDRRQNLDICADFPSSSSSQSSWIHSHSSSCSPSKAQHEKPKAPNLIAKLMGLEEVPLKAVNTTIYKNLEKEKVLNMRGHLLDIDLPRPRKPQFMVQKVVRERRTLEEMIGSMQFKGLLGEKSNIDGFSDGEYRCDDSFLRKSLVVDGPPIVLMRPIRVPAKEFSESYWIDEGKPIKSRQVARKIKEEITVNGYEVPKELQLKSKAGKTPKQKVNKDKEGKDSGPVRLVKKTPDIKDRQSTAKRKEAIVKKIDNVSRLPSNTRKHIEAKDAKSAKTQNPVKVSTLSLSKSVCASNVSKCQIAQGKADKNMKPTLLKSSVQKKNLQKKSKTDSKPSSALVESIQKSDEYLPINVESDNLGSPMKSTVSEQITEEVIVEVSCISISDDFENAANSWETVIKEDVKYIEDGSSIPYPNSNETKGCKTITDTRYFLLRSNASFLNHADELFNIGTCNTTTLLQTTSSESEILEYSLLIECAKELMERKSLSCTSVIKSFSLNLFKTPKRSLSLEQLVGEICNGIDDLRKYYVKYCGDSISVDSVHAMLERDLWWNEEVTGGWDLGWKNGCTVDQVTEVMHDVEKLVLSEIVDDVVMEYMCLLVI